MEDKFMYIILILIENYPFCRLKSLITTNRDLIKVPKVCKPNNLRVYFKKFGDNEIKREFGQKS